MKNVLEQVGRQVRQRLPRRNSSASRSSAAARCGVLVRAGRVAPLADEHTEPVQVQRPRSSSAGVGQHDRRAVRAERGWLCRVLRE
ncbi:hypothetical protein [Actinomadura nitritigenes]|uniref:Uncharacterized protein n=1 Tax=Actinomadura nitritigenes TaxID=134602 RepID=A0ABS3R2V7_9ACTN|nr:hypothetical protein [Actinomadura nitritigenes]MBO2440563.1 hypothetical protein [Actinomadura nitritigenes]